jgi:hypothetical protein
VCCGRGRVRAAVITPAMVRTAKGVVFEYVGRTGLTVVGPISGAPYHFAGSGARVEVDARDQAALARVPVLRAVNS